MKPPLSYYGGKQRIASKILPYFPPHTCYVEPFAGGASLSFAKGLPAITNTGHYREVLNDTNELIVNFYRVCKTTPKELIQMLDATPYAHSEYQRAKEINKNPDGYSDIDKAWAVFLGFNWAFSGVLNGGWTFAVMGKNIPYTYQGKISALNQQTERLSKVYIENIDALKLIQKWDSPHTLFYCDPPYVDANQGHYDGYTQEDFNNLVDLLDNIQGSFVLSHYHNEGIPDHWRRQSFQTTMTASSAKRKADKSRTEWIYYLDRSDNTRKDIKKYLWSPGSESRQQGLF